MLFVNIRMLDARYSSILVDIRLKPGSPFDAVGFGECSVNVQWTLFTANSLRKIWAIEVMQVFQLGDPV